MRNLSCLGASSQSNLLRLGKQTATSSIGCGLLCILLAPSFLYAEDATGVVITSSRITESSGLAASRTHRGHFWTHNDSGDGATLYAVNEAGQLTGTANLTAMKPVDWEDIAAFRLEGQSYLLIADTGDNVAKRDSVTLHLLKEPVPDQHTEVTAIQRLSVRFPDGPADCEAIAVDELNRVIWFVTKSFWPIAKIYSLALPGIDLKPTTDGPLQPQVLQFRGSLGIPLVSGMDISASRKEVVIVNYAQCLRFPFETQDTANAWLAEEPQVTRLPAWKQIEAVAFDEQGSVWITSEGFPARLTRLQHAAVMRGDRPAAGVQQLEESLDD